MTVDDLSESVLARWSSRRVAPPSDTLRRALEAAHAHAGSETWRAGEPGLAVILGLLDEMGAGDDALAACIIRELELCGAGTGGARWPEDVRVLVEGQQAAERVWALHAARTAGGGSEGLRRLLLAIIRDLRVVFILLARQVECLRAAANLPATEQQRLARLTADIHAPLANRLGVWQMKWELEDLAFRYLQPDVYRRIARLLDERRDDREAWIAQAADTLRDALADAGIGAEISGRPKHIYSIWRKMQRKGIAFEEVRDVRALRVLVDDVPTCYAALGVVHALWPYLPGEFDDYIASPKGNQYQSLHTAVIGPGGRTLEVQIRSHRMHEQAELGIAAHWRYKEGGTGDAGFERKIAWMRRLLDTVDARDDDAELLAGFRTDIVEDRVYLLTPQSQVIDLPAGATVVDFAYAIHTDVGHRCRGARVNGRIVPLTHQPASGDRVEILTGKAAEPRRDWLSAHHGYLATHRAREKVRAWFKRIDRQQNIAAGRALLERELKRLALQQAPVDDLPAHFGLRGADELFEALALGDVTPGQVARVLHEAASTQPAPVAAPAQPRRDTGPHGAIIVDGVGDLLTQLARCCQPLPGDAITGYITRGRGVSVHRADCAQVRRLRERDASRLVDVQWGARRDQSFEVGVVVRGYDRKWLHKDVTNVIAAADARLVSASARTNPRQGLAEMTFELRVADFNQLSTLLGRLLAVPNVIEARRVG